QRLAERARRLQDDVKQQAVGGSAQTPPGLAERMQQSAEALQRQAGQAGRAGPDKDTLRREAAAQQAIARDLDKLADSLGAAAPRDRESRAMAEQRARAQQLRENI